MEVHEALSQIAEIHRHVARTECYRGYRSVTMAMTAAVAVLGGIVQAHIVSTEVEFVRFWGVLAAFNLLLVAGEICVDYAVRLTRREQRLAWRSVSQFMPSIVAGGVCTAVLVASPPWIALLPGLWCIFFSQGVFASRPYLPHGVGWVGLYYLMAGSVLLALAPLELSLSPWGMAGAFSVGQLLLALTLYWNLERGR